MNQYNLNRGKFGWNYSANPLKLQTYTPSDIAIPLLGILARVNHPHMSMITLRMVIHYLKKKKRLIITKGPSIKDWLNKLWFIYTIKYVDAYERKNALLPLWNNLQDILLNEEAIHKTSYPTFM